MRSAMARFSRGQLTGLTAMSLIVFLIVGAPPPVYGQDPAGQLEALLARARKDGDQKAERRILNLRAGLSMLKPSQLRDVRCGKETSDIFPMTETEILKDTAGELITKILERVAPTLAAALASSPAAGVAAFLTPETIGTDAVEILNNSESRERSEVRNAARTMLQDTQTSAFSKIPPPLMAKIVACSI